MNTNSTWKLFVQRILSLVVVLLCCATSFGQAWHDYSPPPNYFDWQLFAPVGTKGVETPSAREGYFGSVERMNMWLLRPNRSPVGNDTGANPTQAFIPSQVNYFYFNIQDAAGNELVPVESSSLLVPFVAGGSFGPQLNSIDDAMPRTSDGNGNRLEFGWVSDGYGWLVAIQSGDMNQEHSYGLDDKRIDQIPSVQGLPGTDGTPAVVDEDGVVLVAAVAPTAPTPGFQSIPGIDGLYTTHVNFLDPLNLLLGFTDTNADLLPDDLNGDGLVTFGAFPAGDQTRIGVVFDRVTTRNRMNLNSFELMTIRRKKKLQRGANAEAYLGVRYMELDDQFNFSGLGGVLHETNFENKALNRIVGPQFGFRISKRSNRWTSSAQVRFTAGANFASIRQKGIIADHAANHGTNGSFTPGITSAFGGADIHHRFLSERFSPVGEFNFDIGYQVTTQLKLKAGWRGMVSGGVARAANTVLYQVPTLGILNRSEDMFAHAVSIGVEMNR